MSDAAEHLDALESEIIRLEADTDAADSVHEIFRHLHSLKGMSAAMRFEAMSGLAHRLEDLVALHRDRANPMSRARIELLLQGVDVLRGQMEALRHDQTPTVPEELLAAIDEELRKPPSTAPQRDEIEAQPPAVPTETEKPARYQWSISARIEADSQVPAARAYLLLRRLQSLGRLLSCRPSLQSLRQGNLPGGCLEAVVATDCQREELLRLSDQLAEIASLKVEAVPEASAERLPPMVLPTVRVQTALLDFFMDSISELTALLGQFEEIASNENNPAWRQKVRALGAVVRRLRERLLEVRLVPAAVLAGRLMRACRDVAAQQGKQVQFALLGEGVGLDRSLIEILDAPLLHLVRNAVAHGIEEPERRRAAGKPPAGIVELGFSRSGERVQVTLRDDGAGIDAELVRRKARQLGLPSEGGRDWLWETISHPGFSTKGEADGLSGRGVGLDVVRKVLEQAGGRLRLETRPGEGTSFAIDLPLSLAVIAVLLVECGGFLLALPVEQVARVAALEENDVAHTEKGLQLLSGGRQGRLYSLATLLGGGESELKECVVLQDKGRELFLGVGRVLSHRELVVRRPGWLLSRLGPYAGTAVLGNGQPVLLVDSQALCERLGQAEE